MKATILTMLALVAATVLAEDRKKAASEFALPPVFSDHMVLQQGAVIPVWGVGPNMAWRLSCRVGEAVTWAHGDIGRPAGPGKWEMDFYLPPMKAGGPYEMVISNEHSGATLVIRDVWVGEVWLASGQSNMAWSMKATKNSLGADRIERLRLFDGSKWIVAESNAVGRLSAVATFFGRELQRNLGDAVGILSLSCGGTWAENWMSRGALLRCPTTKAWTEEYEYGQCDPSVWEPEPPRPKEKVVDAGPAPETKGWARLGQPTNGWTVADMPCDFTDAFGYPFNGAAWFRREIDIPAAWAGKDLTLALPAIDKHDIAFFNGVEIGRTGKGLEWEAWNVKRTYVVPGRLVKAGRAVVAIRIWSYAYGAGCTTGADHFRIGPRDGGPAIELEGDWLAKIERDIGNLGDSIRPKRRSYPEGPTTVKPSSWYLRSLKPVIPYPIRGAVWYQGESNAQSTEAAAAYRVTLEALIDDWRRQWGLGDFPFGIVQLANFSHRRRHVRNCPWAELRDAQLQVARETRNVGITSTIDIGDDYSIHPNNKLDVGRRLCRWALSEVYGRDVGGPYTGPRYLSGAVEANGRVRIRFTEAEGGIVATAPVTGCVMRGRDGAWHAADVAVDGETVVVSCPAVPVPREVRYGWSKNPIGATLHGKASGLPVFPFRWVARADER